MEVSLNNMNGIAYGGVAGAAAESAKADAAHEYGADALSVTSGAASVEDIEAAGIPDSVFDRKDALGALVSAAFSLPPPQMPAFG